MLKPILPSSLPQPKQAESPSTEPPLAKTLRLAPLAYTWPKATQPPPSTRFRTSFPRPRSGIVVDVENKPGTYGPGTDYTHPKITAIGWAPLKKGHPLEPSTFGRVFSRRDVDKMREIAEEFREVWNEADFAVGHNIRRHDRKLLDGWYMTLDLPLLAPKRLVDTYLDQPKLQGLSRSLENLTARWGCPIKKPHLEEHVWEAAYDGQDWAMDVMRRRVQADCNINRWLYFELVRRGLLV